MHSIRIYAIWLVMLPDLRLDAGLSLQDPCPTGRVASGQDDADNGAKQARGGDSAT